MGFTTETFLFLFLPVTILICLYVPEKRLHICTLLLNAAFYLWAGLETALVFLFYIIICYMFGHLIASADGDRRKWTAFSVGAALITLTYYKYFAFFRDNINTLLGDASQGEFVVAEVAPLGISFVTFSAISYFSDILMRAGRADSLWNVALYLSFFPKLLSGPIARWKDFAPQIADSPKNRDIIGGLNRIALGYAKKAVIADSLGAMIRRIDNFIPAGIDPASYWLKALFYMFELYYDFSGYSEIAIGLGMLFGFKLPENFRQPYTSASITEFWRRWHISLGEWFREYVYIPLGGNRRGNVYAHLFVVFLLTGIWHGANWTFILWGIIHGCFVMLERRLHRAGILEKIPTPFRWVCTTLIIYFSWILFMSPSIQDASAYFSSMFAASGTTQVNFTWRYFLTAKAAALLIIAAIGSVIGRFVRADSVKLSLIPPRLRFVLKETVYLFLLLLSMLFVVNSSYSPFLYFQF